MKEFLIDTLRQLTGQSLRREKLTPTGFAIVQMQEAGIDMNTVEQVFTTGRKVESKIRRYGDYSISVSYRWDSARRLYMITSVRKYGKERG